MLEFVQHRVGDSRIISMISRWLKAGVMENGVIQASEVGTPQGGSISVLLSNVYLHYVLDLWFEKVVKPRLKGEAYLIRYIDDFVVCFQYRSDANRFQEVLKKRLEKFALTLEPNKTRLIEFGRFATEHAKEQGKRLETIYFLGFTHYCTRSRNGNFKVGRKTEKTRFKRSIVKLQATLREIRHSSIKEQVAVINPVLRGHYNYYGMAGNSKSLLGTIPPRQSELCRGLTPTQRETILTIRKFSGRERSSKSVFGGRLSLPRYLVLPALPAIC